MDRKARVIAYYLPQYHPIPENDQWWGKGFTEWTNVGKAKPLFRGHYQPKVPADLGYYDLRMPEVREAQAELAKSAGIEGFCYWHYWFGNGKRLLNQPFDAVLESGKPDFPFCLGWANESWTNKSWTNKSSLVSSGMLIEQSYSEKDYVEHFNALLKAFKDKRYIQVDGKPLFVVFKPLSIPDAHKFISIWQELAVQNGLKGIYFVGVMPNITYRTSNGKMKLPKLDEAGKLYKDVLDLGFDAVNSRGYARSEVVNSGKMQRVFMKFLKHKLSINIIDRYSQSEINKYLFVDEDRWENVYPTVLPNWDRTPRSGKKAVVYTDSTPATFYELLTHCINLIQEKSNEHKIIFLQSWNEWGEGNYVEPDLKYGHGYLDSLKKALLG